MLRRSALWLLLPCALVSAFALAATPPGKPARETLKWGDTELLVERAATATAEDLQLQFYPGAKLREGYTYRVTTKEGKELSYLASAMLTTGHVAEKVAQHYAQSLPGKPKPETIQDKTGKRLVLSVGSKEEVRTVTLFPKAWGTRILLVRAIKRGDAPPLPTPQILPQQPDRRRSPEGRGNRPGRRPRRGRGMEA
jgi:hypothetical protein